MDQFSSEHPLSLLEKSSDLAAQSDQQQPKNMLEQVKEEPEDIVLTVAPFQPTPPPQGGFDLPLAMSQLQEHIAFIVEANKQLAPKGDWKEEAMRLKTELNKSNQTLYTMKLDKIERDAQVWKLVDKVKGGIKEQEKFHAKLGEEMTKNLHLEYKIEELDKELKKSQEQVKKLEREKTQLKTELEETQQRNKVINDEKNELIVKLTEAYNRYDLISGDRNFLMHSVAQYANHANRALALAHIPMSANDQQKLEKFQKDRDQHRRDHPYQVVPGAKQPPKEQPDDEPAAKRPR